MSTHMSATPCRPARVQHDRVTPRACSTIVPSQRVCRMCRPRVCAHWKDSPAPWPRHSQNRPARKLSVDEAAAEYSTDWSANWRSLLEGLSTVPRYLAAAITTVGTAPGHVGGRGGVVGEQANQCELSQAMRALRAQWSCPRWSAPQELGLGPSEARAQGLSNGAPWSDR